MSNFFHLVLIQPLLNALIWLYDIIPVHDLGLAIIALTILTRLILFPSFQKSLKSQKELQKLQPKLSELKNKFPNDKEAQTKATMELYKEHKINPFSSCLPLLLQLPILIALYRVFFAGLKGQLTGELYSFVANPGTINTGFFGLMDLTRSSYVFGILAGALQFIQSKMLTPKSLAGDKTTAMMNAQMVYFMPLITIVIAVRLPAGLALYWIVTTLFAIGQQYYIMRKDNSNSATG